MPTRAALPVYIVIDVSASTWDQDPDNPGQSRRPLEETPWGAARDSIGDLWFALNGSPTARDLVHLRVVEFGEKASDLQPLTRVRDLQTMPKLGRQSQTNYQAVFTHVADRLEADIAKLAAEYDELRQPIVYFITDGMPYVGKGPQPASAWLPRLKRVHDVTTPVTTRRARVGADGQTSRPSLGHRPAIVALGFDKVDEQTLVDIAQFPGVACLADSGSASPGDLLSEVLQSVLDSIIHSVNTEFTFRPPDGMRLLSTR